MENIPITKVSALPECDLCSSVALYDAQLQGGVWGYVCQPCFDEYGCALGLGLGQRLSVSTN